MSRSPSRRGSLGASLPRSGSLNHDEWGLLPSNTIVIPHSSNASSNRNRTLPASLPHLPSSPLALAHSVSSILVNHNPTDNDPSTPRLRARSDARPWDQADEGGTTYLPAPPSPRASPAPSPLHHGASRRRAREGSRSATPAAMTLPSTLMLNGGTAMTSDGTQLLGMIEDGGLNAPLIRSQHSYVGPSSGPDTIHEGDADETDEAEEDIDPNVPSYNPPPVSNAHKLGQWMSTAISGNDITSSCLYVTGLCVADAGIWAPICLFMVVFTLWLFRGVYGEAVTALPLNGGTYSVLLNSTSKSTAAIAACLTILSYVATAVVSGSEAISYAAHLWEDMPLTLGTIILLSLFAFLNLMGITDSAVVALFIFVAHLASMSILVVAVGIWVYHHGFDQLRANYYSATQPILWRSIVYGFSSAMLGVSGFESSANFVEEQKSGVFVLTLRNMWAAVSFFNPIIAFLSLCILDQHFIRRHQADVLAVMGHRAAGVWLEKLISADAFLVLSGGVLTSFVGVTGLCRRLALDRCLPQFLLAENAWRHTNHWIIFGFLAVCSSMYLILNGNVDSLSNVYSVSFMSVMALFCVGNMLLKYKRSKLKREVVAPWIQVITALFMVLFALVGLLLKDAAILNVWVLYVSVTGALIATMFFRLQTLKLLYSIVHGILTKLGWVETRPQCLQVIAQTIKDISGQSIAFFIKSGNIAVLNKAILYVRNNEDCAWIRIIHVYDSEANIPPTLITNAHILDECYPKIKIDLVLVPGVFGPEIIDYLSNTLRIPKNLMFITCPKEDFAHKIETLGGVRLITR